MSKINRKLDEDVKEIVDTVLEKIKEKYIIPFKDMVRTKDECVTENPSPEINLLNSLKPFVDENCCEIIDKVLSSYKVATLANMIVDDMLQSEDIAIRTNGEYHIQSLKPVLLIIFAILIIFLETYQDL